MSTLGCQLVNMFKNKLLSSSKTFVNKTNEHFLVLTLDDSRTGLEGAGDDVRVKAMEDNKELFERVRKALKDAAEDLDPEKDLMHEHFPKNFPRLFAKPGTKKWKGVQIRCNLASILHSLDMAITFPRGMDRKNAFLVGLCWLIGPSSEDHPRAAPLLYAQRSSFSCWSYKVLIPWIMDLAMMMTQKMMLMQPMKKLQMKINRKTTNGRR